MTSNTSFLHDFGLIFIFDIFLSIIFLIIIIPSYILSYIVVQSWRKCLLELVKWRCKNCIIVEKNSIQSILDNGKNQGVYTLLIEGVLIDNDNLESHLKHLVSSNHILRSKLTSKYGFYLWKYIEDFSLNNVLIEAPNHFRGRAITDSNIQECVSEITSKYLPVDQPAWQVHRINCTLNGKKTKVYLVRAHHVLLRQEKLVLASFLPLEYLPSDNWINENDSQLNNLYTKPSALPKLHQKLTESFSNYWNDFLCNNDPIERPELLKKSMGPFLCIKIGVIVIFSTFKHLTRNKRSSGVYLINLFDVFQQEAQKRNFNDTTIIQAFLKILDPIQYISFFIQWICYFIRLIIFKIPLNLLETLRIIKSSRTDKSYPETLTSWIRCYLPLLFQSIIELISILKIVIKAPRSIFNLLFVKTYEPNNLQSISSCGRKVVAWSDPVDLELIGRISSVTGASHTEILLAVTVDSLKAYLKQTDSRMPWEVLTTAKYINQRSIYIKNNKYRGLICVNLPIKTPLFQDNLIEILQIIRENLSDARSNQGAVYILTLLENSKQIITSFLPSVFLKIILNHLTSKYSITITHIDGFLSIKGVNTAIYWNPPQGNCNMSITLHRHENTIRLGVMSDANVSPHHSIITRTFSKSVENLSDILGVSYQRNPTNNNSTPPITISPGY